ncbi:MAG: metal ABC transporter substrate-binding protein [Verrucomicrobia bacterium]|jgi:zinc/manganese transport system substrate-binding protein|nr:metal ABC transporter substrate-binding protein [Verrucomicrobiota bacterium]
MKRTLTLLVLALTAMLTAQAKLNVVATTPDIASIAEVVGGDQISLTTLARPTEDPHFVDAKPSFMAKLNRADVLLHGGAELESGWLPPLLQGSRNGKIARGAPGDVRCNEGVAMLEVPVALDRSRGDIHATGNPHFLMDPVNAQVVARHIATVFAQVDASHAEDYQANARRFVDDLNARMAVWNKALAPFKGAHLVAYHNSWPYFASRFELQLDLFLEPKPGLPPSPAHLAAVIARMKEEGARVIIVDPYLSRKTAERVAGETGATVVDVTQFPGGVKGTEGGYIATMDYLVKSVADALGRGSSTR